MNKLIDASMLTLAHQLHARQTSVPQLVEVCLTREEAMRDLNAFNEIYLTQIRQQAEESQRRLEQGDDLGPLHGMPIAIKANIVMAGEQSKFSYSNFYFTFLGSGSFSRVSSSWPLTLRH